MKMGMDPGSASPEMSELETFGFEPGPGFTLKDFKKYADEFKAQYFKKSETSTDSECTWEPAVEDVEGEYWRIVDKATEEIEVKFLFLFICGFELSVVASVSPDYRVDSLI